MGEIVIEDCDVSAFRALLQFLYTDDFGCLEKLAAKEGVGSSLDRRDSGRGSGDGPLNAQTSLVQGILATSHKYQVSRLRMWCERQLCEGLTADNVCTVLCQAHLYEAKHLEEACLRFVRDNEQAVVVTQAFGSLLKDWPQVMLKISVFIAGVSESRAA